MRISTNYQCHKASAVASVVSVIAMEISEPWISAAMKHAPVSLGRREGQLLRVPAACMAQTSLELPAKAADPKPIPSASPAAPPLSPIKQDQDWFDPADKAKVRFGCL